MQDLVITPLCAIRGDIVNNHKKYFSKLQDCPKCRHILEVCSCKFEEKIRKEN